MKRLFFFLFLLPLCAFAQTQSVMISASTNKVIQPVVDFSNTAITGTHTGLLKNSGAGTVPAVPGCDFPAVFPKVWLYAGILDNGGGGDQCLHINASTDGLTWTDINNGVPVYTPVGEGLRDPSIVRDGTGCFWVAYTSGNYGAQNSFGLLKSTDLFHWSKVMNVPTLSGGSVTTWGPSLAIDNAGTLHAIVATWTGSQTTATQAAYELNSLNASNTSWSAPVAVVMTDPVNASYQPWNVVGITPLASGSYIGMAQFGNDADDYPATSTDLVHWTVSGSTNIASQSLGVNLEDGVLVPMPNGHLYQYSGNVNGTTAIEAALQTTFGGPGVMLRDLGCNWSAPWTGNFYRVGQTSPNRALNNMIAVSGSGLSLTLNPGGAIPPGGPVAATQIQGMVYEAHLTANSDPTQTVGGVPYTVPGLTLNLPPGNYRLHAVLYTTGASYASVGAYVLPFSSSWSGCGATTGNFMTYSVAATNPQGSVGSPTIYPGLGWCGSSNSNVIIYADMGIYGAYFSLTTIAPQIKQAVANGAAGTGVSLASGSYIVAQRIQ